MNQNKKEGKITFSDKTLAGQQTLSKLKEMKAKLGEMVLVAIDRKTSIELPSNLTKEERDERVENYIRLHQPKI